MPKAFIASLKQVKTGKFDADGTSYDDLRRACRHRDPDCIDPLRHVFEDTMSGVIPSPPHSIFGVCSGRLSPANHRPVGPSPRIENFIMINR
jgi:hypothetical protein